MTRYLRLYAHFLRFSTSRALEFRLDFFMRIVMDCVYYAVNLSFFRLLYLQVPTLGGLTEAQAMLFVSIFLVVDAVHMTVFASNLWQLPSLINSGDLDQYLTRPVATLFFVSLRDFAAGSAVNLVMALGIMGWALSLNPEVVTVTGLATLAVTTAIGALLHYLICIVFVVPTFWTHGSRTYSTLSQLFLRFIERPDRIYTGVGRVLLTFVLPLGLVASVPARLVLFGPEPLLTAHFLGVVVAFACVSLGAWRIGLRAYSSASS